MTRSISTVLSMPGSTCNRWMKSIDSGLSPDIETRVTFLLTSGTIDERIDDRVAEKAERLGAMPNDADLKTMALPDEEEYGEAIEDVSDLSALFAHLRGDDA